MANAVVQVAPDSTGKKIQTFENTVGANIVEAQAVVLVDTAGAALAQPWTDNISQWGGAATTLGQKAMAASVPVVIASDQTPQVAQNKPFTALGYYAIATNTPTYSGLAANTPLFSMRWGDATRFAVILKVEVAVFTTVAATANGITERQLIIARGFSISDTGGTAITLTGNNAKRRTSMGTSLFTDVRIGAPLTAGTRTLDANAVASVLGWSGLLSTGLAIGASGASAVSAARSTEGGIQFARLLDATNAQDHPIVLATNEGIVVRIGVVQPSGSTQQTFINVVWAEVASY